MQTTRLSSKGQIIIPKDVREEMGWRKGDELVVERRDDGVLLRRKKPFKTTTLDEVIGCAGYTGPPKTIEDMAAGIDAAMKERWERKRK